MALEENGTNNMVMPVAPMYGGFGGGNGMGFGGDWASWIILFLIFGLFGGGWGNGSGGGFGGGFGGNSLYPWMNQSNQINEGFRDQMINDNVTSIREGIYGISNQLCNGFAGTTAAITGSQNALAQQLYTNQITDLERSFAAQTANTQGMNALQAQLAQCCCDNRAATADLKYTIATENCADRYEAAQNTRDIIENANRNNQSILDKLCQLELDNYKAQLEAKNDTIAQLRAESIYTRGQASQDVQTARILAGQTAEVDALYNRLSQCPIPSEPVYGRQAIFTCPNNNNGCGCGCGGNF